MGYFPGCKAHLISRWSRHGSQVPLTSITLGSICSEGKFEEICNLLIIQDSSVHDSTHMLKWKVWGRKAQLL